MNYIDLIAAVAIGYGMFKGFSRGLIAELTGLLGVIVGIWAGLRLAFIFADYYAENTQIPGDIIPFLAFLTAFLLALAGVYLLGRVIGFIANQVALGLPNKLAGGLFGGLKFAFILGALLSILGNSKVLPETATEGSATYPYLKGYVEKVNEYSIALVPAARNVFEEMDGYFTGLDSLRQNRDPDGELSPEPASPANDSLNTSP